MVEFRLGVEFVDPLQVDPEEPASPVRRRPDAVHIDVLVPEISSQAHNIALIADDINQFELPEERSNRFERPAFIYPLLDRETYGRRVVEVEAEKRVGHEGRHEVGQEEVDRGDVRDRQLPSLVSDGEIVSRVVLEIAYAGNAHAVAIDVSPWQHRQIRPPLAIMSGADGEIPSNYAQTQGDKNQKRAPSSSQP